MSCNQINISHRHSAVDGASIADSTMVTGFQQVRRPDAVWLYIVGCIVSVTGLNTAGPGSEFARSEPA